MPFHAGQGRAGQGRAGQGRAGQGRAGQGRAGQGRAGPSHLCKNQKRCLDIGGHAQLLHSAGQTHISVHTEDAAAICQLSVVL